MAESIKKNFFVSFEAVTSGFESAITKANQSLELFGKGVRGVKGAISELDDLIDRGQAASELSNAFKSLTADSQLLANNGLKALQDALSGTVGKLDILRISNQALNAGLSDEALLQVASAAEKLGDVVGKDAKTAFEELTRGITLGQERLVKYYLGAVDASKAEAELAAQHGRTAKQLSESGKLLAFQTAALEQLREKSAQVADANRTVGDSLEVLKNRLDDAFTDAAQAINESDGLRDGLEAVVELIENTDWARIADELGPALEYVVKQVDYLKVGFHELLRDTGLVSSDLTDHLVDVNDELVKTNSELEKLDRYQSGEGRLFFGAPSDVGAARAALEARREELELQKSNLLTQLRRGEAYDREQAQLQNIGKELDSILKGDLGGFSGGRKKGGKSGQALFDLGEEAEKAQQKVEELAKSLEQALGEAKLSSLKDSLTRAIDAGDAGTFSSLRDQIQQNIEDGVRTAYAALGDDPRVEAYAKLVGSTFAENANEQMQEKLKEAFQSSVDFFADIFENAITGTTFSLEDALKRVAVGFASTLAAGIAQSLGINVSGIGSAQGLGGLIGGTVLDALGFDIKQMGQSALGSVLGSVFGSGSSIAAGTTGIGPIASGAGYAGALAGIGGGSLAAGTIGIGPVASGATYGGALAATTAAGPPGWAIAAAAAAASLILPKAIDFVSDLFGGTKDPDTLARRGLRDELKQYFGDDLMVNTVQGKVDLTQVDYAKLPQFLASSPIGDESVGLASTFAQVLGGGGKLGEDATAIFAQIIGQAGNFNEALINTWGIMDKLGMSAEQLKDSQSELFLDGKIELSEYGQALANLNLLAQNNLAGTGSVADAWNVVISATADNRTKLKALELAYVEFAELGISSFQDMAAYLMDRFGPDAAQVFINLGQAGIDSAEDIKNANADAILAIFNALAGLDTQVQATFRNVGTTIADSVTTGAQQAQEAVEQSAKVIINKAGEISTAFRDIKNNANDLARYDASQQYFSNSNGSGGKQPQVKNGSFPNNPFRP